MELNAIERDVDVLIKKAFRNMAKYAECTLMRSGAASS